MPEEKTFIELSGRERDTPPLDPATGYRSFYAKSDGWYEMDATGEERRLSNDVPGTSGESTYRAILLGANGSLTSTTVAKNTLSAAPVVARSAEGVYTVTLTGAFTADKTIPLVSLGTATEGVIAKVAHTSANVLTISTFLVTDGTTAADFVGTLFLNVTVEPTVIT